MKKTYFRTRIDKQSLEVTGKSLSIAKRNDSEDSGYFRQ
jgi:hypothetical protein